MSGADLGRGADPRRMFYDTIADDFENLDHPHDIGRRLALVFEELTTRAQLSGRLVLDAGCGYGAFSVAAAAAGARVVSLDIAPRLVGRTVRRTGGVGVIADAALVPFRAERFDLVICSEMIEHTEGPVSVVEELARVVRPGGLLIVTTPNRIWQSPVRWASRLRLRPFHGLENFLHWSELEALMQQHGLETLRHVGVHAWPFHFGFSRLSTSVDHRFGHGPWGRLMVNQALLARKPS